MYNKKYMDKIKLKNLVDNGSSVREIAKILGCTRRKVSYWLLKYEMSSKHPAFCKGEGKIYKCSCGEIDSNKFYNSKKSICIKCHNEYTIKMHQLKKKQGVEYLGGKCKICGFKKYLSSLDFHHLDGLTKDDNFANKTHWSWKRLKIELDKCILLCKNCHNAVHYEGLLI